MCIFTIQIAGSLKTGSEVESDKVNEIYAHSLRSYLEAKHNPS